MLLNCHLYPQQSETGFSQSNRPQHQASFKSVWMQPQAAGTPCLWSSKPMTANINPNIMYPWPSQSPNLKAILWQALKIAVIVIITWLKRIFQRWQVKGYSVPTGQAERGNSTIIYFVVLYLNCMGFVFTFLWRNVILFISLCFSVVKLNCFSSFLTLETVVWQKKRK